MDLAPDPFSSLERMRPPHEKKAADRFDQRLFIWEVEAAGIEPASRDAFTVTSTCVVSDLVVGSTGAQAGLLQYLFENVF